MKILPVALSLALSTSALAQAPKPATEVEIPYEKYALPNGMEVILHQDHRLPVVAVDVWYHVGAYDEPKGRTGFAHLFEHMMFQGSGHVADDVHIRKLEEIGATDLNGTTNFDRTNYFETVPSNHLETALWLESDRMGFLLDALTPQKLDTQREVVKNERRQRYETQPYGLAREKMWKALFPAPHPYNGLVIGSMADLSAASVDDVKDFFRTWYAPSNATVAIAGDFDEAQAKQLVEKYFGTLAKSPKPTPPTVAPIRHTKETVIRHDEALGRVPLVFISWLSAPIFQEGDADADVISAILSDGQASRLYNRLVREKQIAQNVSAANQSLAAQSAFMITVTGVPGVDTETLVKEVDAVLAEIREKGVEQAEVTRVVNRLQTSRVSGLQGVGGFGGKADQLQTYNHYVGNPGYIAEDLARYQKVTPETAKQYVINTLDPERRVVLHAVPVANKQAPKETP